MHTNYDPLGPTKPEGCALLVALPMSRAEFISDYKAWPKKDFARFSAGGKDPGEVWDEHGIHLSKALHKLLESSKRAGMHVIERATAQDLSHAFASAMSTITLVAHWRGSHLQERDIACDPDHILTSSTWGKRTDLPTEVIEEVARRVSAALNDLSSSSNQSDRLALFASRLNQRVIKAEPIIPGLLGTSQDEHVVISDLWLETLHRDALDRCAGGQIFFGNRLELADALYDATEVAQFVPQAWSGTVDLGVCNSLLLGHRIKSGRMDRIIIARQKPVDPSVALLIMRCIIDRLDGTSSYADLHAKCFHCISRIIREL